MNGSKSARAPNPRGGFSDQKDAFRSPRASYLKKEKAEDIVVFGGGIIPDEDVATLKEKGVKELFLPGTPTQDVGNQSAKNISSVIFVFPRKIDNGIIHGLHRGLYWL